MNTTSEDPSVQSNDAVESLLEHAEPRPTPPSQMERDVRAAVHSEWQAVSGRRLRWRNVRNVSLAATVLLAVVLALNSLQQTTVPLLEVALLDQSEGTIRLYSSETDIVESSNPSTLFAGQTLQTGVDSAAGLVWGSGGSLRIDERTRIELLTNDEIFLHSGRVYFDSFAATANNKFSIRTAQGLVSHIGTQYMTEAGDRELVVSVREGEVKVASGTGNHTVHRGQRAELIGQNRPVITNTNGVGSDWAWIETVAPNISVDGMSAYEFLQWVGRETGYSIHFSSESVNELARNTQLKGAVNADPRNELRLRMLTMDLEAQFDSERSVIVVSE